MAYGAWRAIQAEGMAHVMALSGREYAILMLSRESQKKSVKKQLSPDCGGLIFVNNFCKQARCLYV